MSSRQIVYADVSTPERREDYLQNCACIPNDPRRKRRVEQLMSSVPTDSPPIPLYQVPQRAPPAKEARVSEEPKRQYTFVTQGQREKLKELFEQHGTNHPVAWYERATGIKSGTCKNLITKLRKGQDLTPAKIQRGRRRILQPDHSAFINRIVSTKPGITLKELVRKVTTFEENRKSAARQAGRSDDVDDPMEDVEEGEFESADSENREVEDDESEDELVERERDDDDDDGYSSGESTDIEPQQMPGHEPDEERVDRDGEQYHPICSVATMCRHLRSGITRHKLKPLTYKIMRLRSPRGNSTALKAEHKRVAGIISSLIRNGVEIAFVDETHWEIGRRVQRGRAPKGDPALSKASFSRTPLTSVSMVSSIGRTYAQVLKGPVTAGVFEGFMHDLIGSFEGQQQSSVVFYMDNAPIHNKERLKEIIEGAGHAVVFGPKYSPEMNPIEFVFGIWKRKVSQAIQTRDLTEEALRQAITNAFHELEQMTLRRTVNHVFMKVYPKVFAEEDI